MTPFQRLFSPGVINLLWAWEGKRCVCLCSTPHTVSPRLCTVSRAQTQDYARCLVPRPKTMHVSHTQTQDYARVSCPDPRLCTCLVPRPKTMHGVSCPDPRLCTVSHAQTQDYARCLMPRPKTTYHMHCLILMQTQDYIVRHETTSHCLLLKYHHNYQGYMTCSKPRAKQSLATTNMQ